MLEALSKKNAPATPSVMIGQLYTMIAQIILRISILIVAYVHEQMPY